MAKNGMTLVSIDFLAFMNRIIHVICLMESAGLKDCFFFLRLTSASGKYNYIYIHILYGISASTIGIGMS